LQNLSDHDIWRAGDLHDKSFFHCFLFQRRKSRFMIEYKYYLALERAQGIGPASLREIHETIRAINISIADIFSCSEQELRNEFSFSESIYKGIAEARTLLDQVDDDYARLIEAGISVILFFEESYPPILHDRLHNSIPPILYLIGNRSLLSTPCAALLGHSNTSEKGTMIIHKAAQECTHHNITVTGGLSGGAGTAAHASAIESGGSTIGVLPCGFFTFELSPRLTSLYDPTRFLLVSPFRLAEEYSPYHAMARNRIIAALSRAMFIVETPSEGGLIEAAKSAHKLSVPLFTAQYAEYPDSASGNELLIKDFGAIPVRGRKEHDTIVPNMDNLIAAVKFGGKK
jgi:DNA processing protein